MVQYIKTSFARRDLHQAELLKAIDNGYTNFFLKSVSILKKTTQNPLLSLNSANNKKRLVFTLIMLKR